MSKNGYHLSSSNGDDSYNGEAAGSLFGPGSEEQDDADDIDLKRLFYTLWSHKGKIISAVVIGSVLAGIIAFSTTPIYRSEGAMLISQPQNNLSGAGGGELASLLSSTYGISTGSTVANELQVLRSRNLSLEMADSLIKQRLMPNGRQYPVLFRSYPDDSMMTARDTVAMRIRSNISFSQVDREADVVSITYESPSPVESAQLVNLAMDRYSQLSTRQNRRSANSAVAFLEEERERIKNQLTSVEAQLQAFMNQERLVQVDAQTEELITRMAELESRKQEAQVKLVATNSAIEQYQERLDNIKPGLAEQYSDATGPNMMRLQYQLAELEMEKMQLLVTNPSFKDSPTPPRELQKINEEIQIYKNRVNELTNNLIAQGDQYLGFLGESDGNISQAVTELNQKLIGLQVEQKQAQAQTEVIDKQLEEQYAFFDNLPDNMMNLARLKRDVKINEELYLTVSEQYAEMSLWKQTQFGLGRNVDSGFVPKNPIKPNKKLYLLVGFILGGILSVGFVFAREAFNTRLDSIEKLKQFKYPLLSVIPAFGSHASSEAGREPVQVDGAEVSSNMLTLFNTVSPVSESFRRLESNIIYSNPDREITSLMVTSATKGEGKTTTIANLGVVLAEAGYRVLMIDADLRRPELHNSFGLRRSPGVVEYLFEDASWKHTLQQSVVPGLSIISAGHEPPNPSAVTQSKAMVNLVREMKQEYDFVLVDTPPYGIITDASALIGETDGVMVVARFNETTEAEFSHVIGNLEQVNADIIGTVLTDFDYHQATDYYYSAGHYREIYQDYASYQT